MILVTCTTCERADFMTEEERADMRFDCGICNKCHFGFTRSEDVSGFLIVEEEFDD